MVRGGSRYHGIWRRHRGLILGAAIGVLVALLIMWVGWWWSLLIISLGVLGGAIGAWLVDRPADVDLVDE